MQVLRDSTLYSCFIEFRSRFSKQVISITIKKRIRSIYQVRESEERLKTCWCLRENLLYRKTFLDSTYFRLKTTRQVSLYLSDLEMNWTSSFLVQSDKLAIVLHLLLAPVGTVVMPAEHEVAHRLSPSQGAVSRCFPQNRRSTLCSVGVRTGFDT